MVTETTFTVPENGESYVQLVVSRCQQLIDSRIWQGIDKIRFRTWLNNFSTDAEKYFAACILDNLIYRSELQTLAMMRQLTQRVLPDLGRNLDISPLKRPKLAQNLRMWQTPQEAGFCFVPVMHDYGNIGKSGEHISRLYRLELQIADRLIVRPSDISSLKATGVSTFIFIDDFLGTGQQFKQFVEDENLKVQLPMEYKVAYVPLAAHERGIRMVRDLWPNVWVSMVEHLVESHGVFSESSKCFDDGVNTIAGAKAFYYHLFKKYELDLLSDEDRMGYGALELLYVFKHAAPDNSLPILWASGNSKWTSLFNR